MERWLENIIWKFSVCATNGSNCFVDTDCLRTLQRILSEDAYKTMSEKSTYLDIICACTAEKRSHLVFLCVEEQLRIQPNPHIFDPLIQETLRRKKENETIQNELKKMLERIITADDCEMPASSKAWANDLLNSNFSFETSKIIKDERQNECIRVDEAVTKLLVNPFALQELWSKVCTMDVQHGANLVVYENIFPEEAELIRLHCPGLEKCFHYYFDPYAHSSDAEGYSKADVKLSRHLTKMLGIFCGASIPLLRAFQKGAIGNGNMSENGWIQLENMVRAWHLVETRAEKRLLLVDLETIITRCNKNFLPKASAQLVCILFGALLHLAEEESHTADALDDAAYALQCWVICINHGCNSLIFMSVLLMLRLVRERPWFLWSHGLVQYLTAEIEKANEPHLLGSQDVSAALSQIQSELKVLRFM